MNAPLKPLSTTRLPRSRARKATGPASVGRLVVRRAAVDSDEPPVVPPRPSSPSAQVLTPQGIVEVNEQDEVVEKLSGTTIIRPGSVKIKAEPVAKEPPLTGTQVIRAIASGASPSPSSSGSSSSADVIKSVSGGINSAVEAVRSTLKRPDVRLDLNLLGSIFVPALMGQEEAKLRPKDAPKTAPAPSTASAAVSPAPAPISPAVPAPAAPRPIELELETPAPAPSAMTVDESREKLQMLEELKEQQEAMLSLRAQELKVLREKERKLAERARDLELSQLEKEALLAEQAREIENLRLRTEEDARVLQAQKEAEVAQLQAELEQLKRDKAETGASRGAAETERRESEQKMEEMRENLEITLQRESAAQTMVRKLQEENRNTKARVMVLEQEVQMYKAENVELKKANTELKGQLASARAEVQEVTTRLNQSEAKLSALQQEFSQMVSSFNSMISRQKELDLMVTGLQKDLEKEKADKATIKAQLEEKLKSLGLSGPKGFGKLAALAKAQKAKKAAAGKSSSS